MSRSTSAPFVVIVSGWSHSASTRSRARDLPFAFDRLVRIGVGAEGDRVAAIAGLASSARSNAAALGFAKALVSKSRPARGRGTRGSARVAVDAAVLAPWYGLIDCAKPMSGESLRLMIVRAGWMRTVVLSGGGSSSPPASSTGAAHPSSTASRCSLRKRLAGLKRGAAPLARRGRGAHRLSFRVRMRARRPSSP
jgi:hypothetical protein